MPNIKNCYYVEEIASVVAQLKSERYLMVTHDTLMERLADSQRLTPVGAEPDACPLCSERMVYFDGVLYKLNWICSDHFGQA